MMDNAITFVTVFFEPDYDLMLLQARSMARYCPPALAGSIIVIDNCEKPLSSGRRERLRKAYGSLSNVVRFFLARDLFWLPNVKGWQTQQVAKLLIAAHVDTARYLALDAKNHLISELAHGFLESSDGRARNTLCDYRGHVLRGHLESVLNYLGIDPSAHIGRYISTATPFVLYTDVVRRLIAWLSEKERDSFERAFTRRKVTEFFLYGGYLIKYGPSPDLLYDFTLTHCPTVWEHGANEAGCLESVRIAVQRTLPFFGVHRQAIVKLDASGRAVIANFWKERGLFPSKLLANYFLVSFSFKYYVFTWRKRIRSRIRRALSEKPKLR